MSDAPKKVKMVKTTITVAQGDLDLLRAAGKAFEGIKLSQVVRAALRVGIPALAKNPGLLWIPVQPVTAADRVDAPDVDRTPPLEELEAAKDEAKKAKRKKPSA